MIQLVPLPRFPFRVVNIDLVKNLHPDHDANQTIPSEIERGLAWGDGGKL